MDSLQTYIDGESDLSVRSKINSNFNIIENAINNPQVMIVEDQKSNGVNGGTFTAGSYLTRTLNAIKQNTIPGASLSSNQITLTDGVYKFYAFAPAYACQRHKARIRNITDNVTVSLGTSQYSHSASGYGYNSSIVDSEEITVVGTKVFELQHYCSFTSVTDGFGGPTINGDIEVYARVKITKIR